MTLLELAEQCEQAAGDSFDLNHAIAAALGIASEPFTASLDAAMTLVGTDWYLSYLTERDEFNNARACFTEVAEPCRDAVGTGAYLELALCAAALRARSA